MIALRIVPVMTVQVKIDGDENNEDEKVGNDVLSGMR
jgi:hypothetical protein